MHDRTTRYDVTITVDRDGGHHPNPAEFAAAAERAASARAVSKVERSPQTRVAQPNLSARFAWHKLGIYVMLGLFIGFAWATVAKRAGNSFINVLVGDSLPKAARLIIPPLILGCVAFIAKDVRVTVKEILTSIARRFVNWLKN